MKEGTPENNKGLDYKKLFSIRYVDRGNRDGTWGFTVTNNLVIFVTSALHPHSHIADTQGVHNKDTLLEGYVDFDDEGKVSRIQIKPLYTRGTLVQQPYKEQERISEAIKNVIKEELRKR